MVWENVPGAFSSNKGEDFRAVLEETIRVVCEKIPSIPQPKRGWSTAGCLYGMGGEWSVAWRILDAQFWGVPQRRRRIALVADFGGTTAPEILFERESLSGDFTTCRTPWENLTAHAQRSIRETSEGTGVTFSNDVLCLNDQGGSVMSVTKNISGCLRAQEHGHQPIVVSCTNRGQILSGITETLRAESHGAIPMIAIPPTAYGICSYASNSMLSDNPNSGFYEADTSRTLDMNCGNPTCNQGGIVVVNPTVYDARGNGDGNTAPTMTGDHNGHVSDFTAVVCYKESQYWDGSQTVGTLTANNACGSQRMPDKENFNCIVEKLYSLDRASFNQGMNAQYNFEISDDGICPTLVAKGPSAVAAVDCRNATENDINGTMLAKSNGGFSANCNQVVRVGSIVRRLTPLECERLQGFPDGWTDIGEWTDTKGKVHKECADTARYKALGNSIALPPWLYILQKLSLCCDGDYSMASLFDGIGGFPLLWEYLNGKGTCLWASEIEEFPIAVTKYHFSEE